jgi:DNA-binding GntR family transcriptional regulator
VEAVEAKLTMGPTKRTLNIRLTSHIRVALELHNLIIKGEQPVGSKLPSESRLCKKYGVSRPTIRRPKELLIEEGLIESIRGSGSFVSLENKWKINLLTIDNLSDAF